MPPSRAGSDAEYIRAHNLDRVLGAVVLRFSSLYNPTQYPVQYNLPEARQVRSPPQKELQSMASTRSAAPGSQAVMGLGTSFYHKEKKAGGEDASRGGSMFSMSSKFRTKDAAMATMSNLRAVPSQQGTSQCTDECETKETAVPLQHRYVFCVFCQTDFLERFALHFTPPTVASPPTTSSVSSHSFSSTTQRSTAV